MRRLAPLVLAAACAGRPPPRPADSPAPVSSATRTLTTRTHYRYAGRLWNAAIAALPAGARRPTFGHPGRGYHVGALSDPGAWRAFAAAAEIRDLPEVRFPGQMVVFALLDDHTSVLTPATWKVDGAGRAVFTFGVGGAEPDDPDATNGTLAVVDRAGVKSIAFRTLDGRDLGTVSL